MKRWPLAVCLILGLVALAALPRLWPVPSSTAATDAPQPADSPLDGTEHTSSAPRVSAASPPLTMVSVDAAATISPEVGAILQHTQAGADGWDSEVFAAAAKQQLDRLAGEIAAALLAPPTTEIQPPAAFAHNARSGPLRPGTLETVLAQATMQVSRWSPSRASQANARSSGQPQSVAQSANKTAPELTWQQAVDSLREPQDQPPLQAQVHLKITQVDQRADRIDTQVVFHSTQHHAESVIQQNGHWTVAWTENGPRILTIQVTAFEQVQAAKTVSFTDQTAAVLGQQRSFTGQLSKGIDHWRGRLESNYGVDPNGLQGLALGDVNGDGLEDLFVCQQGGLPNRLYVQQPDGRLQDVTRQSGVGWMEMCRSALLLDLDNDGDQDLVMAQGWHWMIMRNDGTGAFTVAAQAPCAANLHSVCAADFDHDGDLDVFFCGRNPAREQHRDEGILGMPVPYHDANNGGPNLLLQNNGNLQFSDVTERVGLDANNRRYSYAAAWEDYDNDGDQDLYVANDFGRNNLYQNQLVPSGTATFVDVAGQLGVEDISAGMSVAWGDYDNNGRMDVYVSNMFSSAGNRIAYQRQFMPSTDSSHRQLFQRHARGNSLFANVAAQRMNDVSLLAGVTQGRWAWGSQFADLNNDGWLDLYVANGFITTQDTGDL